MVMMPVWIVGVNSLPFVDYSLHKFTDTAGSLRGGLYIYPFAGDRPPLDARDRPTDKGKSSRDKKKQKQKKQKEGRCLHA
ncbi:hypothetical protein TEQG_08813 [Trichophyton equinum CBS 127.97]|uniref:Uncharacterized protein n=1 Tax=Trichophyton equinum (strain ATCC MYA-4606 / CBS 127.97) TaxID=559882 RepID=F2Q3K4_TRIEC|nr:hypothetical protein TEQG_08813 [Trichophyton equinum CBS 127.97]